MAYRANRELGLAAAKPYQLRLPKEVRKSVEECARSTGRSLNAELVRLIEAGLEIAATGAREPATAYSQQGSPATSAETLLLQVYRDLGPEEQLALLAFLRGVARLAARAKR